MRCAGSHREHGQACPHGSSPPCRCSLERGWDGSSEFNLWAKHSIFVNPFYRTRDMMTFSGIHFGKPFLFTGVTDFNMAAPTEEE